MINHSLPNILCSTRWWRLHNKLEFLKTCELLPGPASTKLLPISCAKSTSYYTFKQTPDSSDIRHSCFQVNNSPDLIGLNQSNAHHHRVSSLNSMSSESAAKLQTSAARTCAKVIETSRT